MDSRNLPYLLDPETVKKEFFSGEGMPNLNLAAVYKLFRQENFPSFRIGRRYYVPRDLFVSWLNEQAERKAEIS